MFWAGVLVWFLFICLLLVCVLLVHFFGCVWVFLWEVVGFFCFRGFVVLFFGWVLGWFFFS